MASSGDITISGCSSRTSDCEITVGCSRWSISGFEHTISFWATASQRNKIYQNILPKAVDELYSILGEPSYFDTSYTSSNTLKIIPVAGVGNLSEMRSGNLFAINDYSEEFVNWETLHIKFSCFPVAGYVG